MHVLYTYELNQKILNKIHMYNLVFHKVIQHNKTIEK